jgi:hypothetical protein
MGRLQAVLRASLPGEPERLAALDRATRAPLPLSSGVGVLGAAPDAPSALVGGLLAGVLAARRAHRVLAVGARRTAVGAPDETPRTIAWYAGLPEPAATTDATIARRAGAGSGAEATEGLARAAGGAFCLDLAGDATRWWNAVAPIGRFFDFVVTDWGTDPDLENARATGTVLLVVTAARLASLQAGVDLSAQLATGGTTPLLVVHDTGEADHGLREAAAANDALWLPADPALRGATPPRGVGLRYPTTRAALQVAAAVVDRAAARSLMEVAR